MLAKAANRRLEVHPELLAARLVPLVGAPLVGHGVAPRRRAIRIRIRSRLRWRVRYRYRGRISTFSTNFHCGSFGPDSAHVLALGFPDRFSGQNLPILRVVEKLPSAVYDSDPAPLMVRSARVRVRFEQRAQRLTALVYRHSSSVGQTRHAAEHEPVVVGHRQHGDPDQAGSVRLHPDRRLGDRAEQLREGQRHRHASRVAGPGLARSEGLPHSGVMQKRQPPGTRSAKSSGFPPRHSNSG